MVRVQQRGGFPQHAFLGAPNVMLDKVEHLLMYLNGLITVGDVGGTGMESRTNGAEVGYIYHICSWCRGVG